MQALPADHAPQSRVRLVGKVADVAEHFPVRRDQHELLHPAAMCRRRRRRATIRAGLAVGVEARQWKIPWIRITAGPSVIRSSEGRISSTTGKTSLTGAFCARS